MSERDEGEQRVGWRRLAAPATPALCMVLGAVLAWTGSASSQASCTETLPAPLMAFCPGQPARASQANHNFDVLGTAIRDKVGALTSTDVTVAGSATLTGTVDVPDNSFTGADLANGSVTAADLASGVLGTGLRASGAEIQIDPAFIDGLIQVRGEYSVDPYRPPGLFVIDPWNALGASNRVIPPTEVPVESSICFLVRAQASDDSDQDDTAMCQVVLTNTHWELQAWTNSTDGGGSAAHECKARCLVW